mmetsp:Transcript_10575/g.23411  ORF Transcript_10575/g.23411 Transcript_10575/m.23411 type:complete len:138 (-) Transcript_10575:7-420(-)
MGAGRIITPDTRDTSSRTGQRRGPLYGMNAIENMILAVASINTDIQCHQANAECITRDNWRTMMKTYHGKSHDELRQSITSLSSSHNSLNLPDDNLDRSDQETKLYDYRVVNGATHLDFSEKCRQLEPECMLFFFSP